MPKHRTASQHFGSSGAGTLHTQDSQQRQRLLDTPLSDRISQPRLSCSPWWWIGTGLLLFTLLMFILLKPKKYRLMNKKWYDAHRADLENIARHHPPAPLTDDPRQLAEFPPTFDLRDFYKLSPVLDQGNCGSCDVVSTVTALMDVYAIKTGKKCPVLCTQHVINCLSKPCFGGLNVCRDGALFSDEMRVLSNEDLPAGCKTQAGTIEESCQPYEKTRKIYEIIAWICFVVCNLLIVFMVRRSCSHELSATVVNHNSPSNATRQIEMATRRQGHSQSQRRNQQRQIRSSNRRNFFINSIMFIAILTVIGLCLFYFGSTDTHSWFLDKKCTLKCTNPRQTSNLFVVTDYTAYIEANTMDLKNMLYVKRQPILFAFPATNSLSHLNKKHYTYVCPPADNPADYHQVVLIGWVHDDVFIARNSWGTGWGKHGYFHIKLDPQVKYDVCTILNVDEIVPQ